MEESTRHDKCAIALNNFYDAFAIKVGDGGGGPEAHIRSTHPKKHITDTRTLGEIRWEIRCIDSHKGYAIFN